VQVLNQERKSWKQIEQAEKFIVKHFNERRMPARTENFVIT
jgi:hypothetical protein